VSPLFYIVCFGLAMAAIALVGSVTLLLTEAALQRVLRPLVAFAAGALLGGAFFHMLPAALASGLDFRSIAVWTMAGFVLFLVLEQLLHWHHCQRASAPCKQPLTYLVLLGDALHNLIGGLAIGSTFVVDIRMGITAWLAAAAHEVPQELGDFAVLVHGGWSKRRALVFNVLSGLTFLLGGLLAYVASRALDVTVLVPFAAGNFIYIGASDLVPQVNREHTIGRGVVLIVAFVFGLSVLYVTSQIGPGR
jgi:zinc and cadmium transporter